MAIPRFAWGIDIGNRALKAVRLSPGLEGLIVDDYDVVEHEQVLSNAGDNKDSMIQSSLATFVQRHDMRGGVVAVGVSGQASFARFIKLPPVETKKIPEIVRFEAIQQIPFPLEEVEWSYQLFQDPNSPDVEVGIFAMRKELVSQHIKVFTDLGLNVQLVQMNPLAVYNAMYHDEKLKGNTMIIDLGAENTDLIIAEGESIWLRSIPIGGNNFTETLVKAFKLKFPKAEELKRNAATSKYGRQILQAMKPVFNDLVAEIQRSIGFYASVHRDSRITRVLALGGTFRLPGLQKYVQQNLQIEVHRVEQLGAGAPSDPKAATVFNENLLSSVSAYGLSIQALGGGKITSSLLPARIRREKMWQEKTRWFAAAAAVFIGAPLIAYASISWGNLKFQQTAQVDTENKKFLKEIQDDDRDWQNNVENAGAGDRNRAANFNALQLGRDTQAALLSDISSCLPKPPRPLLDALEAVKKADKSKPLPPLPARNTREIIRIDRVSMEYKPDMTELLGMNDETLKNVQVPPAAIKPGGGTIGGRSGMPNSGAIFNPSGKRMASSLNLPSLKGTGGAPAPVAGAGQHGFIIEVVCLTPKSDGASYVLNKFVSQLQQMCPPDGSHASSEVKKVIETGGMSVGSDPSLQQSGALRANSMPQVQIDAGVVNPHAAMPGNPGALAGVAPMAAQVKKVFNPLEDPVTGEDMSKDTKVFVKLLVIVDPPPKPAAGVAQAQ
jgi:type IV pilus assembly protein PilM